VGGRLDLPGGEPSLTPFRHEPSLTPFAPILQQSPTQKEGAMNFDCKQSR
jgi:hypothetical protein